MKQTTTQYWTISIIILLAIVASLVSSHTALSFTHQWFIKGVVRWWQLTSFEHKFRKRQYWGYVDEVCISDTGDKYGELEFCEAVKVNVSN